ncbi:hypothetical protein [Paraburkholderia atlantica]|uniref:hypothetical protein n=1 Tax=Paraburkholderia atlantica TaxID=2654982 RepID=UPI0012FA33DA|nr:hypothetical protein [Paraburkholderia atlantica]
MPRAECARAELPARLDANGVETMIGVDSSVQVDVNRLALASVLSNLMDNAARHTDRVTCAFRTQNAGCRPGSGVNAEQPQSMPHS